MGARRGLVAVLAGFLFAGCVHLRPAPPVPSMVLPPPVNAPIAPGSGRVYIDVVDGPTEVRAVHPESVDVQLNDLVYQYEVFETDQACRTPCVLDLPLGNRLLEFPIRGSRKVEVDDVNVSPQPQLYRRTLGWSRSGGAGMVLGILGTTFGGCSLATGASLFPVGLATDNSGLKISGAITLGVGAVLTTLGIWAISDNPTVEQPGSGAQYPLP